MTMNRGIRWMVLAALVLLGMGRLAAAASNYTLACDLAVQGRITVQLSSFSFQLASPANGMGGQAGGLRRSNYELTVHFLPSAQAYTVFQNALERNEVLRSCKLTETETGGGPLTHAGSFGGAVNQPRAGETLEWTFTDATLASVTAVGGDGSSQGSGGVPQGSMQAVLGARSFAFAARP